MENENAFPVSRIHRRLKTKCDGDVNYESSIFLASVLEHLTKHVLQEAGKITKESKKTRINPRHIVKAFKTTMYFPQTSDDEGIDEITNEIGEL